MSDRPSRRWLELSLKVSFLLFLALSLGINVYNSMVMRAEHARRIERQRLEEARTREQDAELESMRRRLEELRKEIQAGRE